MDAEIYELIKDMAEYWDNNQYMNDRTISKDGLVTRAKAIKACIDAETVPEPAPTVDPMTVIIELLQDIKERLPEPQRAQVQAGKPNDDEYDPNGIYFTAKWESESRRAKVYWSKGRLNDLLNR